MYVIERTNRFAPMSDLDSLSVSESQQDESHVNKPIADHRFHGVLFPRSRQPWSELHNRSRSGDWLPRRIVNTTPTPNVDTCWGTGMWGRGGGNPSTPAPRHCSADSTVQRISSTSRMLRQQATMSHDSKLTSPCDAFEKGYRKPSK